MITASAYNADLGSKDSLKEVKAPVRRLTWHEGHKLPGQVLFNLQRIWDLFPALSNLVPGSL